MEEAIKKYQQALLKQRKADARREELREDWSPKTFKKFEHQCELANSLSTKTNLARRKMIEAIDEDTNNNGSA